MSRALQHDLVIAAIWLSLLIEAVVWGLAGIGRWMRREQYEQISEPQSGIARTWPRATAQAYDYEKETA